MEINIRPAAPEDISAIAAILRGVEWFQRLAELPIEDLQVRLRQTFNECTADSSHQVLVAEDSQGTILGYTSVHWLPYLILDGPEGYVSELFIHAQARGSGVGTMLLDRVKEEARQRGCSRLMLLNSRERPSYQRDFYKKNGWREREAMANFVFDLK